MTRIKIDENEFINIVRGKLRQDLLEFLKRGQITILGPGRGVAIPVEEIKIPQICFEDIPIDADTGNGGPDVGIGKGPGKPGTDLGPVEKGGDDGDDGDGEGEGEERSAGVGRGPEIIEIEISSRDFYELFKELLELPRIKPKGEKSIKTIENKYTDIRPVGPDSLIDKRRTIKNALRRMISEGMYDPNHPRIIPIREDKRFRSPAEIVKPKNNAVIFFMMDVSGSLSAEDRSLVRYFCALCRFWLQCNYDELEVVWIIHDGEADRVTEEEFFTTQRAGGTVSSTAHKLMLDIIKDEFPPERWNIYPIYLSDGFNFGDDDEACLNLITEEILSIANQYVYCEVESHHWLFQERRDVKDTPFSPVGNFGILLNTWKQASENAALAELIECVNLKRMDNVPDAIRLVFRGGR